MQRLPHHGVQQADLLPLMRTTLASIPIRPCQLEPGQFRRSRTSWSHSTFGPAVLGDLDLGSSADRALAVLWCGRAARGSPAHLSSGSPSCTPASSCSAVPAERFTRR